MSDDAGAIPADPADAAGSGAVHAEITVGGDLSGQVAVGNDIVQVRIDTLHGDLITVAPDARPPAVVRRAPPVRSLPRRPALVVDRLPETARLVEVLTTGDALDLVGAPGCGRSTLLRHVAHQPELSVVPAGVAHLSCADDRFADVARSLFDLFYVTDVPYQPSTGELRRRLGELDAALLLDDVELNPNEAERLLDLVPNAGVVLASEAPILAHQLALTPLPRDDALALLDQLTTLPPAAAADVVGHAPGGPHQLLQAAARTGGTPLGTDERLALSLLTAVPGLRLDVRQLAELGSGDDVADVVQRLSARGLVGWHASAAGDLDRVHAATGAEAWLESEELMVGRDRIERHFRAWAERHRHRIAPPSNDVEAARTLLSDGARRERWALTLTLAIALEPTFAVTGRWAAWGRSLALLDEAATQLDAPAVRAFALHQQGVLASCHGRGPDGIAAWQEALRIRESLGDQEGAAVTRANLDVVVPRIAGSSPSSGSPSSGSPPPPSSVPPGPPPPPAPSAAPGPPSAAPADHASRPWTKLLLGALVVVGAIVVGLYAVDALTSELEVGDRAGVEAPVDEPPEGTTPDEEPPSDDPADPELPPVEEPPVEEPPEAPPSDDPADPELPAVEEPPVEEPPVDEPPIEQPVEDPVRGTTVPDVIGLPVEEAGQRIAAAGLTAVIEPLVTAEPPGTVAAQDPLADELLDEGAPVTLFVAEAPAPRVPSVVGRSLEAADAVLAEVGLTSTPSRAAPVEPSVTGVGGGPLPAGTVIRQHPAAGSAASADDTVDVVVVAVESVIVPHVLQVPLSHASSTLAEAGLRTAAAPAGDAGPATCTIVSQQPGAGAVVARDATVSLLHRPCTILR